MKTIPRPELREPVQAFARLLAEGRERIPLASFAALFGAEEELLAPVRKRGDLVFAGDRFSNDGPDLAVKAGRVEIEIPSLIQGRWSAFPEGFALAFPLPDFGVRACAQVAFLRKCFDLKEIRATATEIVLDFGGGLADRRYTF